MAKILSYIKMLTAFLVGSILVLIGFCLAGNLSSVLLAGQARDLGISETELNFMKYAVFLLVGLLSVILIANKARWCRYITVLLWFFNILVLLFVYPVWKWRDNSWESFRCRIQKDYECSNMHLEKSIKTIYAELAEAEPGAQQTSQQWFEYVDVACRDQKDSNRCRYLKNKGHWKELLPVYNYASGEKK